LSSVAEDGWACQASIKFGPFDQHLLNVRGSDPDDLLQQCGYLANELAKYNPLADLQDNLAGATPAQATQTVQHVFPQAQIVTGGPGPNGGNQQWGPVGSAPTCAHGPMTDTLGKMGKNGPYRYRWYCPAPRGQQKCPSPS
jgi:hypothetical protein